MKEIPQASIKPFLSWAGGKTWIQKSIKQYLPSSINNYHEPFLGGGSVFINLKSTGYIKNRSFLSDRNLELINAYDIIKTKLEALIELLKEYRNEKEFYYFVRNQSYTNNVQRAAQFIYLNRTSFNGIYRVNLNGEYNVPYGYKTYNELFDFDNLVRLNRLFQNASFNSIDFEETIGNIKQNDLVFLDPPYTVAHGNNGFIKYNQKIFAWEDQERLLRFIEQIKSKQAFFIMTNAAHKNIDSLFNNIGGKIIINRHSLVGGKGATRKEISEYLFTNTRI